jgi:hypothetical protein
LQEFLKSGTLRTECDARSAALVSLDSRRMMSASLELFSLRFAQNTA